MNPADEFSIVAASACTAVGPTAAHTSVGIALGLAGFAEHAVVHAGDLLPRTLGMFPNMRETGLSRYPWLGRLAISDLWEQLDRMEEKGRVPVYLALPEDTGTDEEVSRLKRDLEQEFDLDVVETKKLGPAGVLQLIADSAARHPDQAFVVGAIDSFVDTQRLSSKEVRPRLLSDKTKSGFIGGEAASFLCIAPRGQARQFGHSLNVARIRTSAVNMAPKLRQVEALSAMITEVLADLPSQSIDWWAADINGERYRARAYGMALTRVARVFRDIGALRTTTQATGDVGTATAALLLAMAFVESKAKEEGRGLILASAFAGTAGACLVSWQNQRKGS